ncbi:thioesterase-like superfamily-domain-containing protein [Xylaria bambusicola]|uniref:thioesterase-like superfamily-domain-containing protein n=1 Tax=Xylaria bambusicola TaxID=326684 RepID=UPI002007FE03|nr:thioesterase-like superfamily-domain-containing protein [Xylaria bambusicola]KAI0505279.1 thioesterase-like superfamily-domain-containing protein [Xylaria bambusicola]
MATILKSQIDLHNPAPGTYTAAWHVDWTVGAVLHGGCVAAIIHHAAETHLTTDPVMSAKNQPDVANLHIEFLRPCIRQDSTITITVLRTGAATSTIELQLAQEGQVRVIALATAINFDRVLGPTVPLPIARTLYPPAKPAPDFDGVLAHKSDPNWIPLRVSGEIVPFTRRILVLNPRDGFQHDGICDAWNSVDNERSDATYLAMMTDIIPSMSDTLLRNGGLYDAHAALRRSQEWAEKNPGVPAVIPNTTAEAMKSSTLNSTITLDIEFTRRISGDARPRFIFTRTAANSLQDGRMNVDVTICNENMELLCTSHQLILVLEAERKFRGGRGKSAL